MNNDYIEKIKRLCEKITNESKERLIKEGLSCQANLKEIETHYHEGKKYFRIDVGSSGRYMIDKEGTIYGIKAYGVIHKGHSYGTLDTIDLYFWGDYTAYLK
jgi:hypothetical protein